MKQKLRYKSTGGVYLLVLFFLLMGISPGLQAQKKQTKRSLKRLANPEVKEVLPEPKPEEELDEEELENLVRANLEASLEEFLRQLPLIAAQPEPELPPEPVYVTISEELKIDCVWVTTHAYYGVWDSKKLNPYEIDVEKLEDTLSLKLYNKDAGESWAPPLKSYKRISSGFGFRRFRWHYGIDLTLNTGDTVYAAFDGIVRIRQYERSGYGNFVVLRHKNGLETVYGHFSKTLVSVGDEVKAGDPIGLGGNTGRSTGPHLHFETRYMGQAFDPREIFNFEELILKEEEMPMHAGVFNYLAEARKIVYHTVRSGETLSHISRRYGVSIGKITGLNGINKNSIIRVGQRLRIN